MTDRPEASPWLRLLGGLIVSASLAFSPQVLAQEESDEVAAEDEDGIEEITVTGSRLKRDTYSSIAPLQIISSNVSREVGLIDASSILQESTAAGGQQIDLTFSGFVLDNGPGSSTINLRGLGEARTLVLVNGRRLAPSGVEGAPFAANLDLVPASLVQQYDLLLDGASSVYGSDAIAGVANVILRQDFDGFEVEGYSRVPHHSSGVENTLSALWGMNFDRGFIGVGAEFRDREAVQWRDRPWTADCAKHNEIDENGQIRSQEAFYTDVYGMPWDECARDGLTGTLTSRTVMPDLPFTGSVYYTPGFSNGGWGNFSESEQFGYAVDTDQDGVADMTYRDFSTNGKADTLDATLFPENQIMSVMAYGEYTFAGEANITPYFETLYTDLEFKSQSFLFPYFPTVPANNPYNLCNPNAITGIGVDCGSAQDALYTNPGFLADFGAEFEGLCAANGIPLEFCTPATFGLTTGPIGPIDTIPIVNVRGDRNNTSINGDQMRFVGGVRGDMPFMDFGSLDNWTFDLYGSYSKSDMSSIRRGIREDRSDLALGVYSSTDTPCENDTGAELQPDTAPGCVPVDMYAPSLYPVGGPTVGGDLQGDFATQAERDYLFGERVFDTEYEQTVFSGYMTGDLFSIPGGEVAFGIGIETREDELNSLPNAVASEGLLFGFTRDAGAIGSKRTDEAFAEIELPLIAGVPGAQELTINASSRYTDDEFYGGNWTWSGKIGWRPTDSLLIRGTVGTAFRAPNLRELFLAGQTGFNNSLFDPCYVPEGAINPITDEYDPALETRDPQILANCLANGVDPTLANVGGFNVFSVEVESGGSLTLDPEESESWSAGIAWDQPFTNAFDMTISATYYEIDVFNTIIEPGSQFIVSDCYGSSTGNSAFCSRIQRDLSDPTDPEITLIDAGFLNRDKETSRGVDINVAFNDTLTMFNRPFDIGVDVVANRQLERSTLFVTGPDTVDFESFQGTWGFPDWKVQTYFRLDYSDFRFVYELRYTSSVDQNPLDVDEFDDVNGSQGTGFVSDTCLGPPDDVLCRDYADGDSYLLHNASFYYYGDRWTVGGGVRNLFDEEPPVVDWSEITNTNNSPLGYGYDLNGRTYFFNVAVNFGGSQ
jgi:iron complex outermembrane receptor protein